jgi:cation transport ATPase
MTALPGRGARATISGRNVLIGSPRLFREEGTPRSRGESERADEMLEHDGGTVVLVGWNDAEGERRSELRGPL